MLLAAAIAGEDDRYKLFQPFGTAWAGGPLGRIGHPARLLETAGERLVGRDAAGEERGEAQDMTKSTIGDSPRRREDARFVTGGGAYLDDLRFDRLAHAVVLRSPHAHAWIDAHRRRRPPGARRACWPC